MNATEFGSDLADLQFDAQQVEPQSEFQPLPAGEYEVAIIDSTVTPTKNGQGKYLKLTLQVLTGEFQNRQHFENLNLWNSNPQTVQISKAALSAICRAIGVLTPKNSSELVGKTLVAKMSVRKRDDQDGFQNRVVKWSPRVGGNQNQTAQTAPAKTGW